jgi:MoaA/NifB/PqqE/SkfB family radical SAM enzyme
MNFHGITDSMYRQLSFLPGGGVSATLRLGFRCNQDCGFCWQARSWPEPDSEFYFTWLDELAASGAYNLSITGGEPTLHKDLPGLVERAAKKHGMSVSIQTNAIRLAKKNYLQKLVDAGLNDAFVSFHSADPEISDTMTRAPKTHQFTVKGIETALASGLVISLNCVVEKHNYLDLPNHARMIVERFVEPFPDNPPMKVVYSHPCEYYDERMWSESLVALDELRDSLVEATQILTDAEIAVDVLGSCGFPPCLFKDRPHLLKILNRDLFDTKDVSCRIFLEPCEKCALQKHCLRGPRY